MIYLTRTWHRQRLAAELTAPSASATSDLFSVPRRRRASRFDTAPTSTDTGNSTTTTAARLVAILSYLVNCFITVITKRHRYQINMNQVSTQQIITSKHGLEF